MILLVTHDESVLRAATEALATLDAHVAHCSEPSEALKFAAEHEPEIVLVEMELPGLSGGAVREEYTKRFPERRTLFGLLVTPGQLAEVAQERDGWADDFALKPIEPAWFRARVRLMLRRSRFGLRARFRGDIHALPVMEAIQFCEKSALTGRVRFETNQGSAQLSFRAGEMLEEEGSSADGLADVMTASQGSFVIESCPVDFKEIEGARSSWQPPAKQELQIPIGRASTMKFGSRELRVRTEFEPAPWNRVVSTVTLDNEAVQRHASEVPPGLSGHDTWERVDTRHRQIEEHVRGTIGQFFERADALSDTGVIRVLGVPPMGGRAHPGLAPQPSPALLGQPVQGDPAQAAEAHTPDGSEPPRLPPHGARRADTPHRLRAHQQKDSLFDEALRKWREDDFAAAVSLLESAEALDPDDRSVQVCLRVLRRRLLKAQPPKP